MSINRKGSRKITVDGEIYLWRVRDNWDHITVVIQHENEKHQYLISSFIESGVMLYDQTPPITPGIIRKAIKSALSEGWDPHSKTGKPITVHLELPEEWTFEGYWEIKSSVNELLKIRK